MKQYVLILLLAGSAIVVSAQPYKWAIGARLAYPVGLPSVKYNFTEHHTLEGLLEFYYRGFQAVALYEYHGNIANVDGLRWYAGGGLGAGFYADRPYWVYGRGRDRYGSGTIFALTLQPVVGIEYTIPQIPLNLTFDYKPSIDVIHGWWNYGGFGLGVRYAFK